MPELKVANTVIPYTIKKSNRAKLLRVTVSHEGVSVTAPYRLRAEEITRFVETKKEWIYQKFKECESKKGFIPKHLFVNGETLLYKGQEIKLRILKTNYKRTQVKLQGDTLFVVISMDLSGDEERKHVKASLENWFKNRARQEIVSRLEHYKSALNVKFGQVRLKSQKSRWGSCSGKGNLNFNWHLIMAPENIIDYVVVHELCHLIHMNHSKEFWSLVEGLIPDYKARRKWLKDNGVMLRL